jgi:rhodanese-related sulfurtransferase
MVTSGGPAGLDVDGLRRLLASQAGVVVLDVRSPGEYAAVNIEGSVNLPLNTMEQRAAEVAAGLTGPVVLVCAQGVRSGQAARLLTAEGAENLQVLDGGVSAWESAGGEVRRGRGHWAMERQVRLVAGSIVLASVLASTRRQPAKWIAAAIGAGLTYSAVSNTCTMARVLGYLPYNRSSPDFDLDTALNAVRRAEG